MDCGTITEEEAEHHPQKNIITRALGVDYRLEPEFATAQLHSGDILLLCSDGLTGMLEDEEILQILEGEGNVEERAQRLVQAANDHGGRDNIAVIIMEPFSDEVSG